MLRLFPKNPVFYDLAKYLNLTNHKDDPDHL